MSAVPLPSAETCASFTEFVPDPHKQPCACGRCLRREMRHHEVLCLVLKWRLEAGAPDTIEAVAQWANMMADAVYPPPKEQP